MPIFRKNYCSVEFQSVIVNGPRKKMFFQPKSVLSKLVISVVLTWVGEDRDWFKKKAKYAPEHPSQSLQIHEKRTVLIQRFFRKTEISRKWFWDFEISGDYGQAFHLLKNIKITWIFFFVFLPTQKKKNPWSMIPDLVIADIPKWKSGTTQSKFLYNHSITNFNTEVICEKHFEFSDFR